MKKIVYYLLTIILGLLLSILSHVFIEYFYLRQAIINNVPIQRVGSELGCALPLGLQVGLPIAGVILGFFLGRRWWQIVYVEGRRQWFRRKNINLNKLQ